MSQFTEADVVRYAKLARIHVPEEKRAAFAADMSGIFGWIEQIQAVDTKGIEPLVTFGDAMPQMPDVVSDGHKVADVLANAPDKYMGFFAVPKVIE
jgi:aspartyl-tRNA(Asn)/glutamyl-tRNA(Gln) amidotransferase subunit C